jgi:H+/Cl- antiporter ClcA
MNDLQQTTAPMGDLQQEAAPMDDLQQRTARRSELQRRTLLHVSIWTAAGATGVVAVLFARLIAWAQTLYLHKFSEHPDVVSIATPALFVAATAAVRFLAREAKGSGIPQVIEAIALAQKTADANIWQHRLVSLRTAAVKILSSTLGILGGASIGREGPTVQIATSIFSWVGNHIKRLAPGADFPSFATAGAAAGVAAAFNAPLAGITFAMEELAEESFALRKAVIILGVVIAGIAAQMLAGNYLYFGHPALPPQPNMLEFALQAIAIAIVGGFAGGGFARLLAHRTLPLPKSWWAKSLICGLICSAIGYLSHGDTAGSGYEVTRAALESISAPSLLFPVLKFVTTVFSYLSGMAGGIFSPCLSIGAGIGFAMAALAHFASVKACALVGMVSFFSGVVQAPLTAVMIVLEMTDQRELILPFIIAAFVAQSVARQLMPVPLYRFLAEQNATG